MRQAQGTSWLYPIHPGCPPPPLPHLTSSRSLSECWPQPWSGCGTTECCSRAACSSHRCVSGGGEGGPGGMIRPPLPPFFTRGLYWLQGNPLPVRPPPPIQMVIPGADYTGPKATPEQIAEHTVTALRR